MCVGGRGQTDRQTDRQTEGCIVCLSVCAQELFKRLTSPDGVVYWSTMRRTTAAFFIFFFLLTCCREKEAPTRTEVKRVKQNQSTHTQTHKQTTKQPNNQTTKQPNKQPNNQTTKQPNNQTTKQPNKQTRVPLAAVSRRTLTDRGRNSVKYDLNHRECPLTTTVSSSMLNSHCRGARARERERELRYAKHKLKDTKPQHMHA